MKKKIIFAVATGFFAVATMFNMNMVQANSIGDISLESIMIMQKAEAESGSNKCGFDDWTRTCEGKGSGCNRNNTTCY